MLLLLLQTKRGGRDLQDSIAKKLNRGKQILNINH